jgi:excisionase family DNA binding protein
MSSMMSATMTSRRVCENAEACVAYARLGEPAKLSKGNADPICFACQERRLDEEVANPRPVRGRDRRPNGAGSIYREHSGRLRGSYTDKTGKRRYISGETRQEVEAALAAALTDMRTPDERSGMETTNGNGNGGFRAEEPAAARIEKHYTVQQVAGLLSIHRDNVYKMINAGDMGAVKFGPRRVRVPESSLRAWMEEHQREHAS